MAMLCLVALVAACSEEPARPDLGRLYRVGDIDTTPVIVIPGVFGSRLRDRRQRRRSLARHVERHPVRRVPEYRARLRPRHAAGQERPARSLRHRRNGAGPRLLRPDHRHLAPLRRLRPRNTRYGGAAGRAPLLHLSVRLAAGQRRSGARARSPDRSDSPRLRQSVVAGRHRRAQHGRPDRALLPALRHRRRARRQRAAGHALRHDARAQAGAARNAEHGLGLVAARLPDRRAESDSSGFRRKCWRRCLPAISCSRTRWSPG